MKKNLTKSKIFVMMFLEVRFMEKLVERIEYLENLKKWREKDVIKVVTGVRRSGKSTLFNLYIAYLKSIGVNENQIIHINLEDVEFEQLHHYKALHKYIVSKLAKNQWTYVFIDEVQTCIDFEKAIDGLYVKKNVDVHITGSNAFMLSGELATLLSGRYVEIKMLPFSFTEFSQSSKEADPKKRFYDYLNFGSFPIVSTIYHDIEQHDQYLEGVYNTILLKDIATRNHIHDITLLKNIIKFLCSNVGSRVSTANITKTLAKSGRKITQKTVDSYVKALTDCYLFYFVERYNIKGKNLLKTLGKYYIVDTGLRNHLLMAENLDIGHQIENVVFLELLRRGYRVNIGKLDDSEIDFVASKTNTKAYYQVSASVLDEKVLQRELSPLRRTKDEYPKFLLTLDDFEGNHEGIQQVNLIDWLWREQ